MAKFLANENVPAQAVEAARNAGYDLAWIHESHAGADDDTVLALSLSENRVLVKFDKDFGEMAFRQGKKATSGVVLLRPRPRSPDYLGRFLIAVLALPVTWEGHFCVAQEGKARVVPLP
jgi:predicted nuclease of predicted toxin-antitoxin system